METGSVPIQNAGTQISRGELSAIAVIKNGPKGWEVLTHLVSFVNGETFSYVFLLLDWLCSKCISVLE